MIALIDGDILTYRIGWACEGEPFAIARHRLGDLVEQICNKLDTEDFELFITGKSNFRNDYAVTAPYKGNRKGEKPQHYQALRDYMLELGAILCEGEEADDVIAIAATKYGDDSITVSIDKDFDQVKGWHYNFVKDDKYYIEEDEGLLNFYCQFLVGDRIDNIIGVKGIGPVKALKLLEGKTEQEMFDICVDKLGSVERAIENGRLLWLRRQEGQIWEPPSESTSEEENTQERTEGL